MDQSNELHPFELPYPEHNGEAITKLYKDILNDITDFQPETDQELNNLLYVLEKLKVLTRNTILDLKQK